MSRVHPHNAPAAAKIHAAIPAAAFDRAALVDASTDIDSLAVQAYNELGLGAPANLAQQQDISRRTRGFRVASLIPSQQVGMGIASGPHTEWTNLHRFCYTASQALAQAAAGAASFSPAIARRARQAQARLGEIMIAGAERGHEHLPRTAAVAGNDAQLFVGNRNFLPPLFRDVANAKHVINIIQFNWEPDGDGVALAALLKEKARQGVEVNVIIDAYGSAQGGLVKQYEFFKGLEQAGINVHRNWRIGDGDYMHAWEHRKLYEIDHQVSYLGGLGLGQKYDSWTDLMVRMDGPVTAQAGAQFLGSWVNVGGKISPVQKALFESAARGELGPAQVRNARTGAITEGTQTAQLLANRPQVDLAASEQFLQDAVNVKRRLWVTSPYIGSDEIAKPLRDAALAGKDVRIIVPGIKSGRNLKLLAISRTYYADLIKAGAKVYELPSMMHAKSWIADDVTAVGSMNMSKNSFKGALRDRLAHDRQAAAAAVRAVLPADHGGVAPAQCRRAHKVSH